MTQSFTVKVSHMQGIIFRLAEQRGGRMHLAVIPTIRPDRSQPRAICGSAIRRTHSTPSQMHNTIKCHKFPLKILPPVANHTIEKSTDSSE